MKLRVWTGPLQNPESVLIGTMETEMSEDELRLRLEQNEATGVHLHLEQVIEPSRVTPLPGHKLVLVALGLLSATQASCNAESVGVRLNQTVDAIDCTTQTIDALLEHDVIAALKSPASNWVQLLDGLVSGAGKAATCAIQRQINKRSAAGHFSDPGPGDFKSPSTRAEWYLKQRRPVGG